MFKVHLSDEGLKELNAVDFYNEDVFVSFARKGSITHLSHEIGNRDVRVGR